MTQSFLTLTDGKTVKIGSTGYWGVLRTAVKKQLSYRRTYAALNELSSAALTDLGLTRGELRHVARQAVWGK